MGTPITTADAAALLVRLISAAERRQQADEQTNLAGIFWEGYQAALYDLLAEVGADADESTPLMRRFANVVVLDVSD